MRGARVVEILGRTLALSAGLLGCAAAHRTAADENVQLPELRADIARMVLADQAVQQDVLRRAQAGQAAGPADYARQDSVFAANDARMRAILAAHGWPGRSLVGEEGSHGAWLLLQHADRDLPLQRTALELMERAARAGEASGRDFAYLTDRVRLAEGRQQVFGTQLQYDSRGCASPKPSEDAETLDARRASMGLESISAYIDRAMTALGRGELCRAPRGPELVER
jgi:hypothetical protein